MPPVLKFTSQVVNDVTVTTTTEQVIATVTGVSTPGPGSRVVLRGRFSITTGASTTAVTPRIRRGSSIADTLIGEATPQQLEVAAGATEDHDISWEDFPGEVAGQTYVLTVQQTAAAANGTVNNAYLEVEVG